MDVCEGIYTYESKISISILNLIIDSHGIMYYVIIIVRLFKYKLKRKTIPGFCFLRSRSLVLPLVYFRLIILKIKDNDRGCTNIYEEFSKRL